MPGVTLQDSVTCLGCGFSLVKCDEWPVEWMAEWTTGAFGRCGHVRVCSFPAGGLAIGRCAA